MEEKKAQSENMLSIEPGHNNLVFSLSPVEEKPRKKGSKYDIILDAFMDGKDKIIEIISEGKTYISSL